MYQVMIADDEAIERMVLHKTVQKHLGDICEIHQAENGREALKIYEEKKIQIAILDIEMPGINGIRTAQAQIAAGQEPPQAEAVEAAEDVGESGYGRISKVSEIIRSYICEHYMNDLSMQDVARMMNYSEAYFCKLFKQCFSCNFTAYLTQFRMEEAKKLLAEPTVNVKNVGEAVGYSDSNYFAKVFKRYTGSSPTEYRMELFQQK